MKKTFKLMGVLVACFAWVNLASAETYDMETDMNVSEFDFTEDTVINGNGHTIIGNFSISTPDIDIVINNATIDANAADGTTINAIELNAIGTSLELNNVTVTNYTKSGLYADKFLSLVIDGSTFDGSKTPEIGEGSGPEADLMKRSAAGIDINIGNTGTTDFSVEKIEITNSTFRNVLASEENTTGGGIKVKVKNWAHLTSMCDVVIENNTFTDNVRDLVVGTNAGGGETTQAQTGDITFKLFGNSAMKVVNNSSNEGDEAARTEVIDSDYLVELNYYTDTHKVLTEDETGLVVDATTDEFDLSTALTDVASDNTVENLVVDYGEYTITINKEDIKADLADTLTDLSLVVDTTTTNEVLNALVTEGVFISTNESGVLPAEKVTLSLLLEEYAGKTMELYYFNPTTEKLEFVSEVVVDEFGNANFDLSHYSDYVLVEATEDAPVVENPSTNDNILTYAIIGVVATIGIVGSVIYLKKSKAN